MKLQKYSILLSVIAFLINVSGYIDFEINDLFYTSYTTNTLFIIWIFIFLIGIFDYLKGKIEL